ncbi:MAG: type I methionyl aminopeptidase [Candidatus Aminicenantes bacterium]|nr:type I methionyl aminopeptidase [Candidatus Aminicenantes bacterium]
MIVYKTEAEIARMRDSARITGTILAELGGLIQPGLRTAELDAHAERRCREFGAKPAFKGYRGFPGSICVSINEEVIHGFPSSRKLRDGDLVSLDFGVLYGGYYGDAARTYPVGTVGPDALRLVRVAEESFENGLLRFVEGNHLSDISHAVQTVVESAGFSVIRSFVGHGIGQDLHEDPQLPNFGFPGRGPRIRKGLVLAIEPMIAAGRWEVDILSDGWTAVTRDRSLAAHFEETVALTDRGVEVLSRIQMTAGAPAGKELPHA